jgi:hypothetical protein
MPTGLKGRKVGKKQTLLHTFKEEKSFAWDKRYKASKQDIFLHTQKLDNDRRDSSPSFEPWNRPMLPCSWYSIRKN